MTDTSPADHNDSLTGRHRWRRPLIRLGIAFTVFGVLFYGGGGWYFASQLGDDAFIVEEPTDDDFTVEVVGIGAATITLSAPDGDEPTLATAGVSGFEHTEGRLLLGDVTADLTDGTNDIVTREFEVMVGSAPAVGDYGDLDSWTFPDDPAFLFPDVQRVNFESQLGPMDAWYVPGPGNTWVVLVHGKGATPRETLRMMDEVETLPMLSITYRNDEGQPADPSGYYRYGVTEWTEVEAAVQWALTQGADDIILAGFSTGAALDMAFMYHSELADRVSGIIFDAPNLDFGRTVDFGASQRSLPLVGLQVPQSLTTVAKFIGSLRFNVNWAELDYIDDIERVDVPMLIFHGTADTTVPPDVSERLARARPDLVTLRLFDGAEHVQSWNTNPARYASEIQRFLDRL